MDSEVVLQFGDKRFSNSFNLNTTLWEILRYFEENDQVCLTSICQRGDVDSVPFWREPAIIFVNKCYSGVRVLTTTTLKSMGILKSQRVSLFFSTKPTVTPFESVKSEIDEADFLFNIRKGKKPIMLAKFTDDVSDFQRAGPGKKLSSDSNSSTEKASRLFTDRRAPTPRKLHKEVGEDSKYFNSFMIRDGMVQNTGEFAPSIPSSSSSSSSTSSSTRHALKPPIVNAEYQRLLTLAYTKDHGARIIFPDTAESNVSTLHNVKANANVTSVRVVFSDGYMLEGLFHRNNTLADLHDFVRQRLQDPMGELYLVSCFPPPRRYDSSRTTTLFAAGLHPVSRVVAQPRQAVLALKPELMEQQIHAQAQAEEKVAMQMGMKVQQARREVERMRKKRIALIVLGLVIVGVIYYFVAS